MKVVICLIKRTLVFTWKAIMRFEQNRQNECEFFLRNAMPAVHFPSRSAAPPQKVPFPRQRRVYIPCLSCLFNVSTRGGKRPTFHQSQIMRTHPMNHTNSTPTTLLGENNGSFHLLDRSCSVNCPGTAFGTTVTFTRLTEIDPGLCGVHANVFIKFSKTLS